jgi:hypothetical protein
MDVPYDRQTYNNPNPFARFAHRTRLRRSQVIVEECLRDLAAAVLVDFGCGQGRFLHELWVGFRRSRKGGVRLLGYDPYMESKFEEYQVVSDLAAIPDGGVDVITCLEVCEHLDESEFRAFLDFVRVKLRLGGWLLVTVPIMCGPVVLLKELSRMVLFRRWSDTSPRELWYAAVKRIAPARAANIKTSHRGYDWRITLEVLKAELELERIDFSPIPSIGWQWNSQALMLLRKHRSEV